MAHETVLSVRPQRKHFSFSFTEDFIIVSIYRANIWRITE